MEGADVNHVNPGGGTPLKWASSEEFVDVLLKAGADPNKRFPLIGAARCGELDIVKSSPNKVSGAVDAAGSLSMMVGVEG